MRSRAEEKGVITLTRNLKMNQEQKFTRTSSVKLTSAKSACSRKPEFVLLSLMPKKGMPGAR